MSIPSAYDLQLRNLMRIFLAENTKINLSALRTEEACWIGNIEDSLAFLDIEKSFKTQDSGFKLIDIGTGGGFPLLPLAITRPDCTFTGLDTIKKKIDAIGRIADEVHITNTTLIADRAEVLGKNPEHREQYDVVLARAVAPLHVLLEYCSPFAKVGGIIVLWKSMHIEEELKASAKAQQILHCTLTHQHSYALPGDFGTRQLLVFTKTAPLSDEYPRKVGMAKKEPL